MEGGTEEGRGKIFDASPAGYVLNRLGNVKSTYDKMSQQYGVQTKKLADAIDQIENYIALSDAKTHEDMMDILKEADQENHVTLALTGDIYDTKISDLKYAEKYAVTYYLLQRNASSIRRSLSRNGNRSDVGRTIEKRDKLRRVNAVLSHMRKREDGLIGKILAAQKKEKTQEEGKWLKENKVLLKHFDLKSISINKRKRWRNYYGSNIYVYQKIGDKWASLGQMFERQVKTLDKGEYVVLKNPIKFNPISKVETIDSYALLSVIGDIEADNIRGFSGATEVVTRFIADAKELQARIGALAAEAYRLSKGHPDGPENWKIDKDAENILISKFMKKYLSGLTWDQGADSPAINAETVHDIAGYLMKPMAINGEVTYAKDRNFALPALKINKRMTNATLRWLMDNGREDIAQDIVQRYGRSFRRRYDNIPDINTSSMYSDGVYREKNFSPEGKSEIYNMIADQNASFLYHAAITEVLKDEMTFLNSKVKQVRDQNDDVYRILRFGTYEDIKVGIDPFIDPKSTKKSVLDCLP